MAKKKKSKNKSAKSISWLIAIAILCIGGWSLTSSVEDSESKPKQNDTFENLEDVVTPNSFPSQVVNYEGMTLSFNRDMHIPNWVAWELTATEVAGNYPRDDNFRGDDNVVGSAESQILIALDQQHFVPTFSDTFLCAVSGPVINNDDVRMDR